MPRPLVADKLWWSDSCSRNFREPPTRSKPLGLNLFRLSLPSNHTVGRTRARFFWEGKKNPINKLPGRLFDLCLVCLKEVHKKNLPKKWQNSSCILNSGSVKTGLHHAECTWSTHLLWRRSPCRPLHLSKVAPTPCSALVSAADAPYLVSRGQRLANGFNLASD